MIGASIYLLAFYFYLKEFIKSASVYAIINISIVSNIFFWYIFILYPFYDDALEKTRAFYFYKRVYQFNVKMWYYYINNTLLN